MGDIINLLLARIKRRLYEQNKNYLAVFVGETGCGKSYSALKFASMLDENFDIDRVVIAKPEEFIRLCKELYEKGEKGAFIVFDEAGLGIPARDWLSLQNKLFTYVLQLFRKQNLGVIFTVPSMRLIDVNARILFHAIGHCYKIDYENQYVLMRYYVVKHNPVFDQLNLESFVVQSGDGTPIEIETIKVGMPDKDLIEAYEQKKDEFMKEYYENILADLERGTKRDGRSLKRLEKKAEVVDRILSMDEVNRRKLARELNIPYSTLHKWLKEVEKDEKSVSSSTQSYTK